MRNRIERKKYLLYIGIFFLLMSSACVSPENESPAPGCRRTFSMGGCNGKTIIMDVTSEPQIDCLVIEGDNCNGGILDVRNMCEEDLTINNLTAPAGECTSFDMVQAEDGGYDLYIVDYNFSDFTPDQDVSFTFEGFLGEQKVHIHFVKSAPYCN